MFAQTRPARVLHCNNSCRRRPPGPARRRFARTVRARCFWKLQRQRPARRKPAGRFDKFRVAFSIDGANPRMSGADARRRSSPPSSVDPQLRADRGQHVLDRRAALGDGRSGAMKVENPHAAEARLDQHIGGFARETAARDAHLHDVDALRDRAEHRRHPRRRRRRHAHVRTARPARPRRLQPARKTLAVLAHQGRRVGRAGDTTRAGHVARRFARFRQHAVGHGAARGARHRARHRVDRAAQIAAIENVVIEIDGDHRVGAHRARGGHRHRIAEAAVDEPDAVVPDRREDARNRNRGAHRVDHATLAQPDLAARVEFGRDRRERHFQVVDRAAVELLREQVDDLAPAQQPARKAQIEQPHHGLPRELADPVLEPVQIAIGIDRAHQRADRGAADHIGPDARFLQRADRADMRPAARRPAAQHEPHAAGASSLRHHARLPRACCLSCFRVMAFCLCFAPIRSMSTLVSTLVSTYHVRARRRRDMAVRAEMHVEIRLRRHAALVPFPAPDGLLLEPVGGYLPRFAEQRAHLVLTHADTHLREVFRRERLGDGHEPSVRADVDHEGLESLRAARIFEAARAVVEQALGFGLAHLLAHLLERGHAGREALEQQRVGLHRIEEGLEALAERIEHGVELAVVAAGERERRQRGARSGERPRGSEWGRHLRVRHQHGLARARPRGPAHAG
ncbi:hypothetical protein PT2222_240068 [Paraburkholderia tropica]